MKIALVSETWRPSVDGVVIRLEHTVEHLVRAGHRILIAAPTMGTPQTGVEQYRTNGAHIGFVDPGRRSGLPDFGLGRRLAAFEPDVVHFVNPLLMGTLALRAVARRYPIVVSFHTDITTYLSRYKISRVAPILHQCMRTAYRRADLRLATSRIGEQRLRSLGIDGVGLWPPGVEPTTGSQPESRDAMRTRLNPEPHLALALCVGRLAREKDCWRLLPVVAGPSPAHLTFVGDGPARDQLEQLYVGSHASFAGVLRGSDLANAYAAADVLLFPSSTETIGLVLLEAMSADLPVVAIDSPAARQTLDGYQRAIIIPPASDAAAWATAINAARATPSRAAGVRGSSTLGSMPSWAEVTADLASAYATLANRTEQDSDRRSRRAAAARC